MGQRYSKTRFMGTATAIRWIAIGLHTIVAIFGVVMVGIATGLDVMDALRRSASDLNLQKLLFLALIVVGGNLIAAVLIATRLFSSQSGIYILLGYEFIFLLASLAFLSFDYSIVTGIVIAGLLYVAKERQGLAVC
jgi:hypothetical protein